LRGGWQEADASLALLAAKGPIFEEPAPMVQLLVAAYHELIEAWRSPASVDATRVGVLLKLVHGAGSDIRLLGTHCALSEAAQRAGANELAAGCEPLLRRAHENGVVLTAGWAQSIERLLAGCASAAGRIDEAELWYQRAIASTRAAHARVELACSLIGRARLRAERRGVDDASRALADAAEALGIANELALLPLAKEAERVVATLTA
jgi:hypothetical protein